MSGSTQASNGLVVASPAVLRSLHPTGIANPSGLLGF